MKLAQVLVGTQWLIGVLERGLPPSPGSSAAPGDAEIVLRHAAVVVYMPIQVTQELTGGAGLACAKVLEPLPLEGALVTIEYDQVAPPWGLLTVDPGNPPDDPLVRRYLAMFGPIAAGDGRSPLSAAVSEDRKSTRLNSSHIQKSRMPSSA